MFLPVIKMVSFYSASKKKCAGKQILIKIEEINEKTLFFQFDHGNSGRMGTIWNLMHELYLLTE